MVGRSSSHDAVRITTAPTSRADDIAGRQRRYLISMAIRTVCFVGAVAIGPGLLRWVFVAGAVLLPYIAVVFANPETSKSDGFAMADHIHQRELPPPT